MRRKSVLLILALALLLTMGGPAFAEYPGRLAANAMTNLMPDEYAVVENSSTPLHEILHMDRATIEEMMGQEPYYTFWIIEGNRQIGLDDSLNLEPGDEITIEIRNTTGLNHQFKVYYFQYEDVAPEEANTGDFDDNPDIYGPGLGVDGNEPADEPIEMPEEEIRARFSDISSDKWYYTKVVKLAEKGIITGYDDGTFKPSNNVTVAEFMVMLNRALKTMDQSLVQSSVTNISLSGLPSWAENDITTIARKVSDNGFGQLPTTYRSGGL